jgi:hypothetical protein
MLSKKWEFYHALTIGIYDSCGPRKPQPTDTKAKYSVYIDELKA